MNIANRVHNIIDDLDMKQVELARRLGIPYSTLNGYMTERNQFPLDVICAIADELKVTTDYLLGRTDEPGTPFHVNSAERKMVEDFRTLYRQQKELIVQNIHFMQEQNQK